MFCPKCACETVSDKTNFCSKCGFTLKPLRNIFENGSEDKTELSSLQKGARFGAKLLILAVILFPVFQVLSGFFTPDDKLVESSLSSSWFDFLTNAILIALALSGISRIFYAIVFERLTETKQFSAKAAKEISGSQQNALPPSNCKPASDFGRWKTTGELFEPIFVKRKTSGELK
jgi:hypothetical protein